jgi:DNA-binding NarL/FixJ family response regulator
MMRVRILIADDHALICAGFQKILESSYEVVGCVGDGLALLREAAELKPDVVLLDIAMPLLNGLDATRQLKKTMPNIKLVFLTMNSNSDIAGEALRVGASAYLLKNSSASELVLAVDHAVKGKIYVTPQISLALEQTFVRDPKAAGRLRHLTSRQREVLQMLAEGRPMTEIGDLLGISYRTVRFHKASIMDELEITSN